MKHIVYKKECFPIITHEMQNEKSIFQLAHNSQIRKRFLMENEGSDSRIMMPPFPSDVGVCERGGRSRERKKKENLKKIEECYFVDSEIRK